MNSKVSMDDEIIVAMNGVLVISMIDTGTHRTLLRFSEYLRIGGPPVRAVCHPFYGLGESQVMPVGAFWADLLIQEDQYKMEAYVIPNDAMDERMLLGKELTRQTDIRMKGGILSTKKLENDIKNKMDMKEESEDKAKKKDTKDDSIEENNCKKENDKEIKEEDERNREEDGCEEDRRDHEEDESKNEDQEHYEKTVRELCAVN